MWKRILRLVALAAATAVLPSAHAHHAPGPIKVVALLSTTGPQAYLGQAELKGLQLGVEEINAAGGLMTHKVELVALDDQGDPRRAAELARQYTAPDRADVIIGGTTTDTSLAIANVANKAGIAFLSLGGANRITSPIRPWVFKTPPSESLAAIRVVTDMGKRGIKRIALLTEASEFGQAGRQEVRDLTSRQSVAFKKFGVTLGPDLVFQPDETSVAAQTARVRQAQDIDAVFVFGSGEGPALATRELRRQGVAAPIYHSHGVASDEFLKLVGKDGEGLRLPGPAIMVADRLSDTNPRKAKLVEFASRYRARYGEAASSFSGYAYDALMIAADAIRRAPLSDFEWIRRAIENTRGFVGVTGVYNYFQSDHLGLDESALLMLEVEKGAWRLAD